VNGFRRRVSLSDAASAPSARPSRPRKTACRWLTADRRCGLAGIGSIQWPSRCFSLLLLSSSCSARPASRFRPDSALCCYGVAQSVRALGQPCNPEVDAGLWRRAPARCRTSCDAVWCQNQSHYDFDARSLASVSAVLVRRAGSTSANSVRRCRCVAWSLRIEFVLRQGRGLCVAHRCRAARAAAAYRRRPGPRDGLAKRKAAARVPVAAAPLSADEERGLRGCNDPPARMTSGPMSAFAPKTRLFNTADVAVDSVADLELLLTYQKFFLIFPHIQKATCSHNVRVRRR